ncbi:hypothetical protein [Sphingomonas sp.]|uniref:hypothetical protein n=1 Tax=Sphingomonas sp. TaxID=28214 RepID=UPI0035C7F7C2
MAIISGNFVDALLSADSTKLYAIENQRVTVFDVASGATLATYSLGNALGGADLSPDGTTLLVADRATYAATDATNRFFSINLATGAVSTFADTAARGSGFGDVAFLTNTTALVTGGATANGTTVRLYDFTTGTYSAASTLTDPTLSASADHSHVLVGSSNAQRRAAVFRADGTLLASGSASTPGNMQGTSRAQAISSDGGLVAFAGYPGQSGLALATSSFGFLPSPAVAAPYLGVSAPLAFSADGKTLFEGRGGVIIAIDVATSQAIGSYAVSGAPRLFDSNGGAIGFGNAIRASADGRYLSVIAAGGVELIDLATTGYVAGSGNDTLTGFELFGFAGDDTLINTDASARPGAVTGYLYGGTGDDRYYIDSASTQVIEYAGQGTDTIYSSVGGYIPANVENMVITGTGANGAAGYGGYGNDLDNVITGSALADRLDGYGGNDTLIGNAGNDDLRGFDGNDTLSGGAGDDVLNGGAGDDLLDGGPGNNRIDGDAGSDTLVLAGARASYTALVINGHDYLIGAEGANQVANVEQVRFADATVGFADTIAGAAPFDALRYIASYGDLIRAFGNDPQAGARHFDAFGFAEGRSPGVFDGREYLASNPDLAALFGNNASFGVWHYVNYGFNEGRPTTSFDAQQYLAANTDVLRAFGNNPDAGLTHYLSYGADEGRATGGFDAVGYLLSNPDIAGAGYGATGAFAHWLVYGAAEGRAGDAAFGREQGDHALPLGTAASQAIDRAGDHDWFQLDLAAGQQTRIDVSAAFDQRVSVHDAAGHLLASASGTNGHVTLDLAAGATGAYYVTVEALDAAAQGNYSIIAG